MFLAQLGPASAYDFMKVRNFPLSLTDTAFAWFTSLLSCSIGSWAELEEKFHSHLYSGTQETNCLILYWFAKGAMNLLWISLNGLEKLRTDVFI